MRAMLAAVLTVACIAGAAADGFYPDLSGLPSRQQIEALQAQIPQPASTIPPTEMIGGEVGTPGKYRPADARQPRITRSKTVTLDTNGTATFDWTSQGALGAPVQVAITPVYTGAGVPKCWATAASATAVTVKCVMETVSLLSIGGINVGSVTNSIPTNLQVGVIVLPTS